MSEDKKILIAAIVLLTGCSNDVSRWEINNSQAECESHGGIYSIIPGDIGRWARVVCLDGTKLIIKEKGK